MRDIVTVMKKDLREWLVARESARLTLISIAVSLGIWGIFLPWHLLDAWQTTPMPAAIFMFLPVFMTLAVVADSFAGERERKTLETLLATRLPDHAIFLGKVAAVAVYAVIMTFGAEVLSLVTVNLARQDEGVFVFRGAVLALAVLGPVFVTFCMAGLGVLVSLRAKSVRTAMQKLRLGMMVLMFGLFFGAKPVANSIPPSWGETLAHSAGGYGVAISTFLFLSLLAMIGFILLTVGVKRFQRHRLILE